MDIGHQFITLTIHVYVQHGGHEALPYAGLHINWSKTKIQQIDEPRYSQSRLTVADDNVEIVDSLVFLGSLMDRHIVLQKLRFSVL